jgi:hypothetical protein
MTRREMLRLMLASAAAEAIDFEKLLWVPKPIVTVPGGFTAVTFKGAPWAFDEMCEAMRVVYLPAVREALDRPNVLFFEALR